MPLTLNPGQTLLFTGDSVTDCGRRDDPEGLGSGYVRDLVASGALDGMTVVNTGIGGNRVIDLENRWRQDVLAHHPDVLSVLVGINDVWRRYDSDDPTSLQQFTVGYRSLLTQAADAGIRLVLLEPFVLPVTEEQIGWREDLNPKIEAMHELAREFDAILVPTDRELTALAAEVGPSALAADGVHPTEQGHRAIADLWLDTVLARP